MRWLLLLHRYLGIAVGALMVTWCVSGMVMMYVSYPALDASLRLKNLAPLEWRGCCQIPDALLADSSRIENAEIEMLAGRPVLTLRVGSNFHLIDLTTGAVIDHVSAAQAAMVATTFVKGTVSAPPRSTLIAHDQWTVSAEFDADRPLYKFALSDQFGTELYVSSTTGRAVQITSAHERFWNWLGSVPHWLYFSELRLRASLWSQVVIYASLLGCFLAGLGIYIGVRQMIGQRPARWSPYRGFKLWHHLVGLVFGIFALTWVASGLLSMNPWGWLEGASAQSERTHLRGPDPSGTQLNDALRAIVSAPPSAAVSVTLAPLNGQLYFVTNTAGGERRRFDARAMPLPLTHADLSFIAATLSSTGAPIAPWLLRQEDPYYFAHHREAAPLPVYRITLRDRSDTRYYVDPVSGMLIAKIDRAAQGFRWWHEGLHRMDFTAALRGRPQWDALMLLLMSGVTLLCGTGTYLGYRRLIRGAAIGLLLTAIGAMQDHPAVVRAAFDGCVAGYRIVRAVSLDC
jgi:PepSY-associated TM region